MAQSVGSLISLALLALPVVVGLIGSLESGAMTHAALSYLSAAVLALLAASTRPSPTSRICEGLTQFDIDRFRKYSTAIIFPGTGVVYSVIIDGFRLPGVVWAALAFWNGIHWLGGVQLLYYFVAAPLSLRLNPRLYLSRAGPGAADFALAELGAINMLTQRVHGGHSEQLDRGEEPPMALQGIGWNHSAGLTSRPPR